MNDSKFTVYVIVVTYNGIKWIKNCLNSIVNSSIESKTIVIDNCSNDGTVELIKTQFPWVQILEMKKNLGFGAANNIGMKRALEKNSDYIFLLNQDAYIENNTIENLISIHNRNLNYGILAPLRRTSEKFLENHILLNIVQKNCQKLLSDALLRNSVDDVYSIDYVGAAAWLISIFML